MPMNRVPQRKAGPYSSSLQNPPPFFLTPPPIIHPMPKGVAYDLAPSPGLPRDIFRTKFPLSDNNSSKPGPGIVPAGKPGFGCGPLPTGTTDPVDAGKQPQVVESGPMSPVNPGPGPGPGPAPRDPGNLRETQSVDGEPRALPTPPMLYMPSADGVGYRRVMAREVGLRADGLYGVLDPGEHDATTLDQKYTVFYVNNVIYYNLQPCDLLFPAVKKEMTV